MKNVYESIKHIKVRTNGIEEQNGILKTTIMQTQTISSVMEKDIYKNNSMKNKLIRLETFNIELETSLSEKFDR